MANSGWTADPADLTVPPDAGPGDPRIFIGGDSDPILQFLDQTNGILFYFGPGRAFVLSVEADGSPNPADLGRFHLWAVSELALFQIMDIDYDVPGNSVQVNTFQDSVTDFAEFSLFGINADIVGLGPDHQPLAAEKVQDVFLFGDSIGRGVFNVVESAVSSAAIGVTETVVLSFPSKTYLAGRAYEVRMRGGVVLSTVTTKADFRLRKTNAAGQDLGEWFRYSTSATSGVDQANGNGPVFTVAPGADVTGVLVLTIAATTGTATHFAFATSPRRVIIEDIGDDTDYPLAPVLT